jgi:hypothetical protein
MRTAEAPSARAEADCPAPDFGFPIVRIERRDRRAPAIAMRLPERAQ